MKEINEISKKKILIDTNILIYCGRDEFGLQFKKILRTLADNQNTLAVSLISGFEIIKKYRKKESVVDYYCKLLNYIYNVVPDLDTMNIAGMMANELYNNDGEGSKKDNDFIIGASAIKNGSLLLTCDKGFSRPFWDVVARECITWEDEDCCKIENVFLLNFNYVKWENKYGDQFEMYKTD